MENYRLDRPGFFRRMHRIFQHSSTRTLIVPFDDLLITGPTGHLANHRAIVEDVSIGQVDAVIGFPGFFRQYGKILASKAWIVNLTASTTLSQHTRKQLVGSVQDACGLGADAVAVHVNFTDANESEMLANLSAVASGCRAFEVPLLVMSYVRARGKDGDENYEGLREHDRKAYTALTIHACYAAAELGADLIKTQFTGDVASFRRVTQSVTPIPVVVAGGPFTSEAEILSLAQGAIDGGAAGFCFGRNTFGRDSRQAFIKQLGRILDESKED